MTPEQFFKRVNKTESCWLWMGSLTDDGYGYANERIDGHVVKIFAHRYSYELHKGPIPKGMQMRHFICEVRRCCNPDHLRVGTHTDNQRDIPFERRSEIKRQMWANMPEDVQKSRAEKIAASKRGKPMSEEARAKMRAAKLGKPAKISEEAKARRREKLKTVWADPEKRAAQVPTDAQRAANAAAHRDLWAAGRYAERKPRE